MRTCVVRVDSKGIFEREFANASAIQEMTEKGYRYKGYIPAKTVNYGQIIEIDLVFEKEDEDE